MKYLNIIGKALLTIACCIAFNLFCDKFWFKEKMDIYHIGGAVFGGLGAGLAITAFKIKAKKRISTEPNR